MTQDLGLQQEIEQFLYREAGLLEAREFEQWLTLLTDDVEYWIPNRQDDGDRSEDAMISYEDHTALRARAIRMNHAMNPTQMPLPRSQYFISNVVIGAPEGDELDVQASVLLSIAMTDRPVTQQPITSHYRLRRIGDDWQICRKRVYVLANNQSLPQLPLI